MKLSELIKVKPAVMGILNVTPDSFSDGGKFFDREAAFRKAVEMLEQGADLIDVGGESTRPGSEPVPVEVETERVVPVIEYIKKEHNAFVSCDTSKPAVAEAALEAGADMINDVTGFGNESMRKLAAENKSAVCIMHMKGTPKVMQEKPVYGNLLYEIRDYLHERAQACEKDGVSPENIIIDPGIGFGKTLEHNLNIIANIDFFAQRYPVLIGASRKSFIGSLTGAPVQERLPGSLAAAAYCCLKGVSVIRVHDVGETKQAIELIRALELRKNE